MDRVRKRDDKYEDDYKHPQLRYLKRKLDDLEEVHRDGKRTHMAEVESLKAELDRSRRTNRNQAERLSRFKKQHDGLEARIQELKSQLSSAHEDARESRRHLRVAEEEREKLSGKQTATAELRRALASAEEKRREEVLLKDRRISTLELALTQARDEIDDIKAQMEECKISLSDKLQMEVQKKEVAEMELEVIRKRLKRAEENGENVLRASEASIEELEEAIEQLRERLRQATGEYSSLAGSSVPRSLYEERNMQCLELQLQAGNLRRKLSNAEEQVQELTLLIRQTQSSEALTSERLHAAEEEIDWRLEESKLLTKANTSHSTQLDDLITEMESCRAEWKKERLEESEELQDILERQVEMHSSENKQLRQLQKTLEADVISVREETARANENLAAAESAVSKLSAENDNQKKNLNELVDENSIQAKEIYALQSKLEDVLQALSAAQESARLGKSKHEEQLRKEKELSVKYQSAAQQSKMAEDALHAQVEQLSAELQEAEAYREAYESLAEEMRGIIARNDVAEEEANKLSQFNAEILSHHNPTQRIYYVDRVRRELAETKQQLAVSTQSYESALAENEQLREELAMYKSVATPLEGKPRTNMTRVRRVPLAARSVNKQPTIQEEAPVKGKTSLATFVRRATQSDMTLDELA